MLLKIGIPSSVLQDLTRGKYAGEGQNSGEKSGEKGRSCFVGKQDLKQLTSINLESSFTTLGPQGASPIKTVAC
jgi:hypothetical protein